MTLQLYSTISPTSNNVQYVRSKLHSYNQQQVPTLDTHTHETFVTVYRDRERVIAGVICKIERDYLYYDAVWTASAQRKRGFGRLVMQAAENYAVDRGIRQAFLLTTSFQARPFYEKLGYRCMGTQANRPRGHALYIMQKPALHIERLPVSAQAAIGTESPPSLYRMGIVDRGLLADIDRVAPLHNRQVASFLIDGDDTIHGGMIADYFWDWLEIHALWIAPHLRERGWGQALMRAAERLARRFDSVGLCCDVASFQNIEFLYAMGFNPIATLPQRPRGYQHTFMVKRLPPASLTENAI